MPLKKIGFEMRFKTYPDPYSRNQEKYCLVIVSVKPLSGEKTRAIVLVTQEIIWELG